MGRRTARWRAAAGRGNRPPRARGALVGALALAVLAGLHGQALSVAPGAPRAYGFAPDALTVPAATNPAEAALLVPGKTYRSTLRSSGKTYFRLELGATENSYVSATAVPRPEAVLSAVDRLKVSLQDADGGSCSLDSASFGAARSPHPIAVSGMREVSSRSSRCQGAGTYYVVVERAGTTDSAPDVWDLELAPVTEPGLTSDEATEAPGDWDSASPDPVEGQGERRAGGEGFAEAAAIGEGVWSTGIAPGQTLFYEVPVDWGQQLHATAELGGAEAKDGSGFSVGALGLALYNPARGPVEEKSVSYDGKQKSAVLDPVPPVDHANRHAVAEKASGMRFAGSYYLAVHLASRVADDFGTGPLPLTLRVRVDGDASEGPVYDGEPVPRGLFEVAAGDRASGSTSGGDEDAGNDDAMTALAVGGIGGGTVLLGGLALWTVAARRRGASA
ncbi:hypothetical protein [Streptomyces broussonetiae]|uniref:Peptidase n=1 Tax=Streptomyces broussonetiae TaxID=2686304 RepID=A0ABV5E5G3_9ACTN